MFVIPPELPARVNAGAMRITDEDQRYWQLLDGYCIKLAQNAAVV
jgi:hypothetical protein